VQWLCPLGFRKGHWQIKRRMEKCLLHQLFLFKSSLGKLSSNKASGIKRSIGQIWYMHTTHDYEPTGRNSSSNRTVPMQDFAWSQETFEKTSRRELWMITTEEASRFLVLKDRIGHYMLSSCAAIKGSLAWARGQECWYIVYVSSEFMTQWKLPEISVCIHTYLIPSLLAML